MTISQHPQSAAILAGLEQLSQRAASTQWRGLLVIRCGPEVSFKWPAAALVLADALADYREHLGTSRSLLVLDMRDTLHGDALAATLPTISAQGLAILVLPSHDSPFSDRLLSALPPDLSAYLQLEPCPDTSVCLVDLGSFSFARQASHLPTLSAQQYNVSSLKREQREVFDRLVRHIQGQVPAPALINAPRGRGKSTLLGVLARELSQQGHSVWLCAPSRRQAATLLSAAGISNHIHYIAPDALLAKDRALIQGCLIVDEAASLPRHMLDTLVERYPKVIMATTSEGYETCGRGFLLQFQTQLQTRFSHFLALRLNQPIRFAANCPLESWLHRALLLTPSEPSTKLHKQPLTHDHAHISYSFEHASALKEDILTTCFHLLMDAHYQTSPNDLKLLLNDATQSLCLQWADVADRTLVGVLWLSEEGGLESTLATAVVRGTRRPPGSLLAQSLARHQQSPAPACASWLRVVRIAVRNDCQQQGLGSALLQHVISEYAQTKEHARVAGIGTSFASAPQINRFWCRHGFKPVRIGSRKDSTTARHSLLMVCPLQAEWVQPIATWAAYFYNELAACQQLYRLSEDYVASLHCSEHSAQSSELDYARWAERRINAFAHGDLDLDSVRPTLLTHFPQQVENNSLLSVAVQTSGLNLADKRRLGLSGRKDLIKQVRQVCLQLLAKI